MENYDFKSRVKELSDSLRGAADFRSTFLQENGASGIIHVCNAEFIFYLNNCSMSPILGECKRKKKKQAERGAFKEVLDKMLQENGFPIGTSRSEYDSLVKSLSESLKAKSELQSVSTGDTLEDRLREMSLSDYEAMLMTAFRPYVTESFSSSTGGNTDNNYSSLCVAEYRAFLESEGIDDLDDDSTLARSLAGDVKMYLETYCGLTWGFPDPRFDLLNDWTLPDNSHRFKVECTVAPENEPQIITQGVAVNKMDAEKIAALKMIEKLQLLNSQKSWNTAGLGLERILSGSLENSPGPSRRQPQTFPFTNGTLTSDVPLHSNAITRVPSGGIVVKDKIVYFPNIRLSEGDHTSNHEHRNEVFKGYYETPRKEAAVKRIPLVKKDSKCDELKFLRELEHANVVRYFCTEEKGLYQFIAMELATSTLEKVVRTEDDMNVLREYCQDVTKGLSYLHENNIIHRDLKPSNILIFYGHGSKKTAKLADFDISRQFDFARAGITTVQNRGTRTYMPPEAIRALGSRKQSMKLEPTFDIFSLALVIHFAMTRGKHLFENSETDTIAHIEASIADGRANWNYTTDEPKFIALRNLLEALIRADPRKRPQTQIILEHPFFWDTKKGHQFLNDVCTDINNISDPNVKSYIKSIVLQPTYSTFCTKYGKSSQWIDRLCPTVQTWIKERRFSSKNGGASKNYQSQPQSIILLIELIRDQRVHYGNWANEPELRCESVFGKDGVNYAKYFEDRFPELVTLFYTSMQPEEHQGDMLRSYYVYNAQRAFTYEF